MFEVNGTYENRKGTYTVLSIGPTKMTVRYTDGSEAELNIGIQERIWENIVAEKEASSVKRKSKPRKALATNAFYIKSIPALTDEDLSTGNIRPLVGPCSSAAPEFKLGDRLITYAVEQERVFGVATITGEPKQAKSKDYAELEFEEETVLVYPIDIDALAPSLAEAVTLDSVELETQPNAKEQLVKSEIYLTLNEDDFELLAELITEVAESDDDDDDLDDLDEDEVDDDDLDLDA